jgi:hypothetical protein
MCTACATLILEVISTRSLLLRDFLARQILPIEAVFVSLAVQEVSGRFERPSNGIRPWTRDDAASKERAPSDEGSHRIGWHYSL